MLPNFVQACSALRRISSWNPSLNNKANEILSAWKNVFQYISVDILVRRILWPLRRAYGASTNDHGIDWPRDTKMLRYTEHS